MQIAAHRTTLKVDRRDMATYQAPRPWMQDFWLWILLVGPLVAPLFMATGIPVLRPFADGIYLLGSTVCPKLGFHFMFMNYSVAVCSSCWSAVFGLWTVRLLYGRAGEGYGPFSRLGLQSSWAQWQQTSSQLKLGVVLVGFLPWAIDVMLTDTGLLYTPHLYMMFAGYMGGLVAAMLMMPARTAMRDRIERQSVG